MESRMSQSPDFKVTRTALIDGDFVAYQTAAWAHTSQSDVLAMTERLMAQLTDWARHAFCSKIIVALSCPREDGFRRKAYPLYKAHRNADPPAMLDTAKQVLRDEFQTVEMKGLEADDIMGILATNGKIFSPVMVSVDKDLLQIPGWHFNPEKQDFPTFIPLEAADRAFHMQWLTGDTGDGFKGLEGIGPKKAEKILEAVKGIDNIVLAVAVAYASHAEKYTRDYCEAMARCARILRWEDWDSENRRPVLFTVPEWLVEIAWPTKAQRQARKFQNA